MAISVTKRRKASEYRIEKCSESNRPQYDTSAKRLLGQKSILVKTVDEFKGMNPKDVVNCIEGTPHISTVPVEPGLTNAASEKNGERLVGFNTENEEINEGLVRFDRFL